ncbi:CPBP family intramembrane metalloprotease domain-containing protein [Pseudoclavibacter sp. RFBG4]|uniref:CPBP family intramembrane glutamic endopeptidase n=1 Tax=Pseudoclavibacter sp. RFBG4 TaxID=2080575 RepID=UPI000CE8D62F|nr:CPBP family intramembrane glutamic endopeptidase [Pseudoclavibacter sp. RFBG4]PPG36377.1 CPBP family intramembrane metalloprotease domain-containing protein [Pseudoclavibacter sp. RFBG4]
MQTTTPTTPSTRDKLSVGVFLALAFGLSWLIALPLWLGDGLANPWFPVISIAMMLTPAIAALVTVFALERPARPWRTLGLVPLKPAGRLIAYLALAVIVPVALIFAALPIGALFGVYSMDLVNFSGFQAMLDEQLAAEGVGNLELPLPIVVLVLLQLVSIPVGAFLNLIPALGEELGWRGWLLPKLLRLGTVPALLISGVIWGLWHAPLILLGYNYADAPGWLGLTMMTVMCILVGAVFAWLRIRSESVWPAALAHGAFNAAAGSYLLFAAAGERVDTTQATILGWTGWIVPLIFVAVLLATKQLAPPKPAPAQVAPQIHQVNPQVHP